MRRQRRLRRWFWRLGGVAVVVAVVAYLGWNYGWSGPAALGDRAPAFALEDGDGRSVNLGEYLGRKPIVLVFYMTYG